MVWSNGFGGIPIFQEFLAYLAEDIPGLRSLNLAAPEKPGMEYGGEEELGSAILRWAEREGCSINQAEKEQLENGWAVLRALGRSVPDRILKLLRCADLAAAFAHCSLQS